MYMLGLVLETLGALLCGIGAAFVACWLAWAAFKLVHHPEWGPLLVFAVGAYFLRHRLGSTFAQIVLLFAALFTVICWFEGAAWRANRAERPARGEHGPALSPLDGTMSGKQDRESRRSNADAV